MQFFESENDLPEIYLNLSNRHRHIEVNLPLPREIVAACKVLKAHPVNVLITAEVKAAMDAIIDSEICFSPQLVLSPEKRLHRAIGQYFVDTSEFAFSLLEELDGKGAFGFIDHVESQNKQYYRGMIMRLLAPFAISAVGPTAVHSVPRAFIHAVVDYYRNDDGSRWNEEILTSDAAKQCARAIVLGLGQVYDDPTISAKAVVGPTTGRGSRSWARMKGSANSLSKELVRRKGEFLETSRMKPSQVRQSVMDIEQWLSTDFPDQTLQEIFQTKDRSKTFSNFLEAKAGKRIKTHIARVGNAKRLLDAMAEQIKDETGHEDAVVYPLISDRDLERLKNSSETYAGKRPTSSRSRPLPEKLFAIATAILDEGEDGVLGESRYFHVKLQINGKIRSIYCPVIPTLFRNAFDIPLRMVQWRRLDSGEGDNWRYDPESNGWGPNLSPLAGYWSRKFNLSPDDTPQRGYAYRFDGADEDITGFWINTNKTGEPYAMPWQHEGVHRRMLTVRNWVEKYVVVSEPTTPDLYLDDSNTPEVTKKELPHIFPLFRLPPKSNTHYFGRIPTTSEMDHAWQFFMYEVEKRWNMENPDEPISIVSFQKKTGQPQGSIYNIHGLRVLGLTNLYRSGIPLELLSKMVAGHATLAMTLYYLEFEPANVSAMLNKAALEARAKAQRDLINSLKNFSVEQARLRTVSIEPAAIENAIASPSKIEYCNVDVGLCPFDCTRCHDGGPVLRRERHKNGLVKDTYAPVEPRNCLVCRHFLTGPEWIVPLHLYGSKLCEKRRYLGEKEIIVTEKVAGLRTQFEAKAITRELYRQAYDALQSEVIPIRDEVVTLEQAIINTELLLKASIQLMEMDKEGKGGNYVTASRKSAVEYVERTQFDHALAMTEGSRFHPILGDERVEAFRDKQLDRIAFNAGMTPSGLSVDLTPEQCRKSLDLQARFLMERISAQGRMKLVKGDATLETLGYREEMASVVSEALGQPVLLNRREPALAIEGR